MRLFGVLTASWPAPRKQMRLPVANRLNGIKWVLKSLNVPAELATGSCSPEHLHYTG